MPPGMPGMSFSKWHAIWHAKFFSCATHPSYWTTNTIENMITNNVIRSTMPDPEHEPELYTAVVANQIHTCDAKCQGPAILTQTCKKGFPQPFSETTYYKEGNSRYTYKCLTQADSWIVPYHAP